MVRYFGDFPSNGLFTYYQMMLTFSSVASDKQSIRKVSKIGRIDPPKNNLMNRLNRKNYDHDG